MADYIKKTGEKEKLKGKLFQMLDRDFEISKSGSLGNFTVEIVRRPPGVRLLCFKDNKILLTKEFRSELQEWDYRLPGGKVFDSLDEYLEHVDDVDILEKKTVAAVVNEGLEEAGVIVRGQKLLKVSQSGSTVEWDLHYYEITDFEMAPQGNSEESAEIIHPEWFGIEDVKMMCLDGRIKEDRTVGVLLKYILSNG